MLHDIDPKVDQSRDLISAQIKRGKNFKVAGFAQIAVPVQDGVRSDFETDGNVLVVTDVNYNIPAEIVQCLKFKPLPS